MDKTMVMASFDIFGDHFDTSDITNALSIEPTEIRTKGVIPNGSKRPSIETSWSINSKKEESYDINDQINQLFFLLKGKQDLLLGIKKIFPVEYGLSILIEVENKRTPAMHFEIETLKFISYIGAEIDIDLYV